MTFYEVEIWASTDTSGHSWKKRKSKFFKTLEEAKKYRNLQPYELDITIHKRQFTTI